ncbi:serine protease [Sphingopyxis sp.]|jgi:serine protease Do|uniref:S1C family serine protease n=1 Tax=Sphingopyxis sp. TaxID=1908224 RepID=UPI002E12BF40
MKSTQPGERLSIGNDDACTIRIGGRNADRITVVAVSREGQFQPLERGSAAGEWRLSTMADLGEQAEILLYISDDRTGGFVNDCYPVTVDFGGTSYEFPKPFDLLAAVIIAEAYMRDGGRRVKVANEGYTFGIEAFARARNFRVDAIPGRSQADGGRERWEGGERGERRSAPPGTSLGSGSGVLVAPGIVVTNAHVIEGGNDFRIGRGKQALTMLAVDPLHDLAILQGEVQGTPLPLRNSAAIWLGEAVLAAGYPLMDLLGADLKVSTGNVSGLKGWEGDVARFQFTAPIGSGSSGGAILDEYGNLVGITSSSLAHGNLRDRGAISENVNFGIKVSLVHEMLAASGVEGTPVPMSTDNNRRNVVQRLRDSVVSIIVSA